MPSLNRGVSEIRAACSAAGRAAGLRENLPFAQGAVVEPDFVDNAFEVSRPPAANAPAPPPRARDGDRKLSILLEDAVDVEIIPGLLEDDRQVLPGAVELVAGAEALIVGVVAVADATAPLGPTRRKCSG